MVIDRVTVSNGTISIVTPLVGKALTAPLPTIELTDIGRDKGGASPAEAFKKIVDGNGSKIYVFQS